MRLGGVKTLRKTLVCIGIAAAALGRRTAPAQQTTERKASKSPIETPAFADARDESRQYFVETLAEKLDNPCGVAVRPGAPAGGPYEVFISESGAGRIVRFVTDLNGQV